MALDFPASPTNGQVYDNWIYSSAKGAWEAKPLESAKTITADVAPANPEDGDQWFNTVDGTLYIYVVDTDGGQWVESQAPITANGYYSPNYIINGGMEISQRGIGATPTRRTGSEYNLDRYLSWQFQVGRFSQQVVTGSGPTSRFALRVGSSDTAIDTTGTRMRVGQKVESLNTYPLRGKTITLSFYIRFSNATFTSSTASAYNNFVSEIGYYTSTTDSGFGVSTSDSSTLLTLTNGSLPTTWTKYTITGVVPTNANNIHVGWSFSDLGSTASNDALWYEITDVQLEQGSVATTFRRNANSLQGELAACQRYYIAAPDETIVIQNSVVYDSWLFPTTMRAVPTMTLLGQGGSGGTVTIGGVTATGFFTSNAGVTAGMGFTASAEL
jgi:hypothetical protein